MLRALIIALAAAAVIALAAIIAWHRDADAPPGASATPPAASRSATAAPASAPAGAPLSSSSAAALAVRPSSSTIPAAVAAASVPAAAAPLDPATGLRFPVSATLTPLQRSVVEAQRDPQRFPERLTPQVLPAAFDAGRWASDPAYARWWLETHEPGRVFQPAQPGAGVARLQRVGNEVVLVANGGQAELAVEGFGGAPITFASFDSGQFDGSGLASINLRTEVDGIGRVVFHQSPGTVGTCRIMAASPLLSDQVRFTVIFAPPVTANAAGPRP